MPPPLHLDSTPREGLDWGLRAIDQSEVESFAAALPLSAADQRAIVAAVPW